MITHRARPVMFFALGLLGWVGCKSDPEPSVSSLSTQTPGNEILSEDNQFGIKSSEPSFVEKLGNKMKSIVWRPQENEDELERGKPLPKVDEKTSQFAKARLAERHKELARAEKLYRELLERYPDEGDISHRLGIIAAKKGKMREAEQLFLRARGRSVDNAQLLSDLGYLYYLQDRLDEAENVLREALVEKPHHVSATNNLAIVLGDQGRYQESLAAFKRVGSEAEAHANLAYIMAQHGDFERAKSGYLHALKLDNEMKPAAHAVLQIVEREKLAKDAELARARQTKKNRVESQDSTTLARGENVPARRHEDRLLVESHSPGSPSPPEAHRHPGVTRFPEFAPQTNRTGPTRSAARSNPSWQHDRTEARSPYSTVQTGYANRRASESGESSRSVERGDRPAVYNRDETQKRPSTVPAFYDQQPRLPVQSSK